MAAYERAASTPDHVAASLEFGVSGCYIAHETPLYDVVLKRRRQRGASGGAIVTVVVARGVLKQRLGVAALWSVVEIRSAFGRKKGYS